MSVADKKASIRHSSAVEPRELVRLLNALHLGASLQENGLVAVHARAWSGQERLRASVWAIQGLLFVLGLLAEEFHNSKLAWVAYGLCVALSWPLLRKAWLAVLRRRSNVELLMAAAMVGSLLQKQPMEAAMVGAIVTVMDTVTFAAVQAVEARLNGCVSVPPATLLLKGGLSIPASELAAGMVFLVRAGEGVLADGVILAGDGAVDESRVTGEALPVSKETGDSVRSGSVLQSGALEVRADRSVEKSFQNAILDAVREAKNTQSGTELAVEAFAVWYTPLVISVAAIVAFAQNSWTQFLVIIVAGCPCAILGAAPFVQASALAVLARRHRFLVKEASALESLARMKIIGVDKTGTITTGHFKMLDMQAVGEWPLQDLHRWAAGIETKDNHPLAHSLVESYTGCVTAFGGWGNLPLVTQFRREGRCGVTGVVEGQPVGVGNVDLLKELDITLECRAAELFDEWSLRGTVLFITVDQDVGAVLLMADSLRGDARGTVEALRLLGVETILLTGDKSAAANAAAAAVGIDRIHAGLRPEDKAALLLQATWPGSATSAPSNASNEAFLLPKAGARGPVDVGFIGDGLNDCLALAGASVGIAMQEVGPQATVDAAAAVLQGGLGQLPAAIKLARRARRLVFANVFLAVAMNTAVIVAAACVGVPLWVSVLADSGGLLVVLANSLWPLCWRIEAVQEAPTGEVTATGGVVAFRPRD